MIKNPPANAGGLRDTSSIPRLGRPLEEGMVIHSGILAWRIPGLRSLVSYSPYGCKESYMTEGTKHTHTLEC